MARNKGVSVDFCCPKCQSKQFVIGTSFPQPGGALGYTLRCPNCYTTGGEHYYVKNISQKVLDVLISQGRIVNDTAPTIAGSDSAPNFEPPAYSPTAQYSKSAIPPAIAAPHVRSLGCIEPEQPTYGRNLQQYDDPFDESVEQVPPPFIASPAPNNTPAGCTQSDCIICNKGLPAKVAGTSFIARITRSSIVYSNELTGVVLLTQHIDYCPFCGKKL